MASPAAHGSAMPLPSASVPHRNQVDGMNCIQPIAPAELGPMFWPKLDSILLIAASTCHGIPYAAPARSQIGRSCSAESSSGCAGGVVKDTGTETAPGSFGVEALGSETCGVAVVSSGGAFPIVNPIGGCARAVPTAIARIASAATAVRFISPRLRLEAAGGARLPASRLPAARAPAAPGPRPAAAAAPRAPAL